MRALVSASITDRAIEVLRTEFALEVVQVDTLEAAVAAGTLGALDDVAALVVEADPVGASVVAALPALEWIACLRADPVNVDVSAATAAAVPVLYTPGRNADSVADFTLGLLLSAIRGISASHHRIIGRELTSTGPATEPEVQGDVIWRAQQPGQPTPYRLYKGPELSSLVFVVVGYGQIGRHVARRLAGLVDRLIVVDPQVDPKTIVADGFHASSLRDALPVADVISLHARSAQVILGARELSAMKRGGYVINTARATVLDYGALVQALRSGHLRGAALDVYPEEPLPSSSPLLDTPGVVLTPHIAGASEGVAARQSEILLDALSKLYEPAQRWEDLPVANVSVRPGWRSTPAASVSGVTASPQPLLSSLPFGKGHP
jgi:D-3-phosphoglycerate dehydrogenase